MFVNHNTLMIAASILALMSGCADAPMMRYNGPSLAYRHGTAVDPRAYPMQYAQAYCTQVGMNAKYVRTFYPSIQQSQWQPLPALEPDDPGIAGRNLEEAGRSLQEAGDMIDSMPTSYYKCF